MSDKTQQTEQGQVETGQAETGQAVAGQAVAGQIETGQAETGPVLEGVVVGHATCLWTGCTAPTDRVVDPFALEVHGEQVEIDICEAHLAAQYDEI
jgi:hypothetical protein